MTAQFEAPIRIERRASEELIAQGQAILADLELDGADHVEIARETLRWASGVFGPELVALSSMGDEAMVHLASDVVPGIDVVFIDTGYHFAETIGTRDAFAATRDINLISITPLRTVEEQNVTHGPDLYARDPEKCCAMRKVEPLERALAGYSAWITGMRREDAPTRVDIDEITYDAKRDMVKFNPLARWSSEQLEAYVREHAVLQNPLRQSNYLSIGCEPCTKPVPEGADARSGRWSGTGKIECGLHV